MRSFCCWLLDGDVGVAIYIDHRSLSSLLSPYFIALTEGIETPSQSILPITSLPPASIERHRIITMQEKQPTIHHPLPELALTMHNEFTRPNTYAY